MEGQARTSPVMQGLLWLLAGVTSAVVLAALDPTGFTLAWRTAAQIASAVGGPTAAPSPATASDATEPRAGAQTGARTHAGAEVQAGVWREILALSPVTLEGAFKPRDDLTRAATGAITLEHAILRTERGGLEARTEPVRILQGRDALDRHTGFAARFGLGQTEQIEIRRLRPLQGDAEALPASPLCQGRSPELIALWPGRGRMVMVLWPQGQGPGPDSPADAACGIWSYRR